MRLLVLAAVVCPAVPAARLAAQQPAPAADTQPAKPAPARAKAWYEKISLRGYAQVRYNRLLESNEQLKCAQCDKSVGNHGGIFLRRARLVFSGSVHDRVSIYIQPDYAVDAAGQQLYLQIRDAYFDLYLDKGHAHRLRLGQSKMPFGFENLQSSSNRLPLDRAEPLNSALPNERDMAAMYYFSPKVARERFHVLTDSGLKGSGDYGVVGLGVFNGQTANHPELNDNLHAIAHVTYPFRFPNGQFVEVGAHAYHGRFVILPLQRSSGVTAPLEFVDERVAGSLTIYPQPFGFQAEWNAGRGPGYVPGARTIASRHVEGGYVQASFRARTHGQVLTPFVRAQSYDGSRKLDLDARDYDVKEIEGGIEWLPIPAFEFTTTFVQSDRRTQDGVNENGHEKGHYLRLQAQFNY